MSVARQRRTILKINHPSKHLFGDCRSDNLVGTVPVKIDRLVRVVLQIIQFVPFLALTQRHPISVCHDCAHPLRAVESGHSALAVFFDYDGLRRLCGEQIATLEAIERLNSSPGEDCGRDIDGGAQSLIQLSIG